MKGGAFIVSSGFTEPEGLQCRKCLMKLQAAKLKDEFLRQAYMGHQKWILIKKNVKLKTIMQPSVPKTFNDLNFVTE